MALQKASFASITRIQRSSRNNQSGLVAVQAVSDRGLSLRASLPTQSWWHGCIGLPYWFMVISTRWTDCVSCHSSATILSSSALHMWSTVDLNQLQQNIKRDALVSHMWRDMIWPVWPTAPVPYSQKSLANSMCKVVGTLIKILPLLLFIYH